MPTSNKNAPVDRPLYRAAIIGCGRIGCGFDDDPKRKVVSTHAGAYFRSPRVELVALSDLDKTLLARYGEKFQVPGCYTDYRKMLAEIKPEILSICTPNETHLEIAEEAVKAGVRAIFCEKPIAESLHSADRLLSVCAEAECILQIDHQRRFDFVHQQARDLIRQGRLGKIQQVTCYYTAGAANTGSHLFDLIRFLFGDIEWIEGWNSPNPSPNPKDPNIDAWLKTRAGFPVTVQACDVKAFLIFETNILAEKGRLRLAYSGNEIQFESIEPSRYYSGYQEPQPAGSPIDVNVPREFWQQGVQHLVECLDRRRPSISSGEDGRAALEIICALRESANNEGKRIYLPLRNSDILIQSR